MIDGDKYYAVRPGTVQLSQSQSADIGKCGSCSFFKRYDNGNPVYSDGVCMFELPPQVRLRESLPNDDYVDQRTTRDTASCSMHKSAGREYAKIGYWKA